MEPEEFYCYIAGIKLISFFEKQNDKKHVIKSLPVLVAYPSYDYLPLVEKLTRQLEQSLKNISTFNITCFKDDEDIVRVTVEITFK